MKIYSEIQCLKAYFEKCTIQISKLPIEVEEGFVWLKFEVNDFSCDLFVDDEYNDFDETKPLVCLFLILNTLKEYIDSTDYLQWCNRNGLHASNTSKWLTYYISLETICKALTKRLGKIDACINPLDYQLRAGVVKELLNS